MRLVLALVLALCIAQPARAAGACDAPGPSEGSVISSPDGSAALAGGGDPTTPGAWGGVVTDRGYAEVDAGPDHVRTHSAFHEDTGDIVTWNVVIGATPYVCVGQSDMKVVNLP
jgi:hypothetical protein